MESAPMQLQMTDDGNELNGLCLLVVEDDYPVAADMCSALMRRGAVIIGPASNLRRTRELLRQYRPNCALLDLRKPVNFKTLVQLIRAHARSAQAS